MKHVKIFTGFIPWVVFSIYEGQKSSNMTKASLIAAIVTLVISRKDIKKLFVLPIATLTFFILLWLNNTYINLPWLDNNASLIINLGLPIIIFISIIIGQPFTMQYAKEEVDQAYWKRPMFIRINYVLSIMWLIIILLMNLPDIIISQKVLLNNIILSYSYSASCVIIAVYLNQRLPKVIIGHNFWKRVTRLPAVDSPFLKGGFQPVHDELDLDNLEIEGTIPIELNGRYLRNGPNPYFKPYTYTYPIDGDGLIHQITLSNGKASYKNRFVKTKGLIAEQKAGKALYGGIALPIPPDPRYVLDNASKNTASINIVPWRNNLLALYEASPAYLLDKDLNTIGEWAPQANFLINAHHRIDPDTSQTYMCSYNTNHPNVFLSLYEFDYQQQLVKQVNVPKPHPTMIHDFVITKNFIVFFDAPAIFNILGNPGNQPFFYYDKELKSRIILVNRRTYEISNIEDLDSFFVYHFVNAYEDMGRIIVDFIHYRELILNLSTDGMNPPRLYRGEIDVANMTYSHQPLDEPLAVEFPAYNRNYTAKPYRYIYAVAKVNVKVPGVFNQIVKYDLVKRKQQVIEILPNTEVSEVTFIPRANASSEDDGYLVLFIYHTNEDRSDFVILDAKHPDKILARVKIPVRVPHGLHGSWVAI